MDRIEALQQAGDHAAAIAALDARLAADPDDAAAYFLRARSHAALGQVQRLIGDLKRAIARDPSCIARCRADDLIAAHHRNPYLVLDLELDPEVVAAAERLRDGDLDDAIRLLTPLEADPELGPTAWFLIGVCRSEQGDVDGLLEASDRAIGLLPTFSDAWFNRGWALDELGHTEPALDAYRQSVAVDAGFGNGWFNLAMALRRLERVDEELRVLADAVAANPDNAMLGYKRAEALAAAGHPADAVAELEAVLAMDPSATAAIAENTVFPGAIDDATLARLTERSPPRR